MFFLRHWFCLVQVSATQFCWFPTVLMARVVDGSNVPISPLPATSSNFGSPDGSGPDLDGVGHRSYDAQFKELRDLLPLVRGFADFDNHVKTISDAVVLVTSRITNVEQIVNTLSAKMVSFAEMEQSVSPLHRMSAPSLHACARLKQMLPLLQAFPAQQDLVLLPGQVDGSTTTGSHGPGSSEDQEHKTQTCASVSL